VNEPNADYEGSRDRFVADSSEFHDLTCSLMLSRQRLKAAGKSWSEILAEQEPCSCGAASHNDSYEAGQ
jgi:hypothetical protein